MKRLVCCIFVSLILFAVTWTANAGTVAPDLANALNVLRPDDDVKVAICPSERPCLQ